MGLDYGQPMTQAAPGLLKSLEMPCTGKIASAAHWIVEITHANAVSVMVSQRRAGLAV